jgi:hypothetical protein
MSDPQKEVHGKFCFGSRWMSRNDEMLDKPEELVNLLHEATG